MSSSYPTDLFNLMILHRQEKNEDEKVFIMSLIIEERENRRLAEERLADEREIRRFVHEEAMLRLQLKITSQAERKGLAFYKHVFISIFKCFSVN